MSELISKLDEITQMVETAKSMPLSSSCVLSRPDLLGALDELRALLPEQIASAQGVLADREELIDQGRREAERIVAAAHAERARLVARSDVAQEAARQAEELVAGAQEAARAMRLEVEDYVDAKLANFEVVLSKTLGAVQRGRDKLRGRHDLEELGAPDFEESPLPG